MTSTVTRVRDLNDAFRRAGPNGADWLMTRGIHAKGLAFALRAFGLVRDFSAFTAGNDPHGEHDFGAFHLDGERIFWKIDYYDLQLRHGSDDPANPAVTRRVLTIMLASEY